MRFGPLHAPGLLGNDDANASVLEGVTVDEGLCDHLGKGHDLLDLLRGDVLSLRQLEEILGAVNDLDGSVGENLCHVTGHEPALSIEAFVGLIPSLVVAREDGGTVHADLASRVRLVGAGVVHIWEILQANLLIVMMREAWELTPPDPLSFSFEFNLQM